MKEPIEILNADDDEILPIVDTRNEKGTIIVRVVIDDAMIFCGLDYRGNEIYKRVDEVADYCAHLRGKPEKDLNDED